MKYFIVSLGLLFALGQSDWVQAQSSSDEEPVSEHYEIEEYEKERTIVMAEEHEQAPRHSVENATIATINPGIVPVSDASNQPEEVKFEKVEGEEVRNTIPKTQKNKKRGGFFAAVIGVAGEVAVQVTTDGESCNY